MDLQEIKESLEKKLEALCCLDRSQFGDVVVDGIHCYSAMVDLAGITREAISELENTINNNSPDIAELIDNISSRVCLCDGDAWLDTDGIEETINKYSEACHLKQCEKCNINNKI